MIKIDIEKSNEILDFITHRPTVPLEVENIIVKRQKEYYARQLINKEIKESSIDQLKTILKKNFLNSLIQPGETVGIICGQCIGEKTTQSSLNNFHSAGLDTGSTSQIDNLQSIINAAKIKKKEFRKFFKISLFLKETPKNLSEMKEKTIQFLEEIKISKLIKNIEYKNIKLDIPDFLKQINNNFENKQIIKFVLNLEHIFTYRITREQIIKKFPGDYVFCLPYSMLSKDDFTIDVYCFFDQDEHVFEFIRKVKETTITGIEGVKSHVYMQKPDGEWYIDCLCNGVSIFFPYSYIYDTTRILCNSVNDINTYFGILVTQELILLKCNEIMPGIDNSHFKILSMRMTKNGYIEPLTRYTMRNNNSPLSKASFEESFETFIKACKFKEKEKFKSISSAIICGKKPHIGTYQCDILIDPKFFTTI